MHAQLPQPLGRPVVAGLDQADHGHTGGVQTGDRVAVETAQLGREQGGLPGARRGGGEELGHVHAPADHGDAVVGPVQGADELGLPGGARDGGEDLERHQPVGPAGADDAAAAGAGTSATSLPAASTESCTTTTSGRPAIELRTSSARPAGTATTTCTAVVGVESTPVGPAGDRLHGRVPDHQGDAAVGDPDGPGRRVGDRVHVDHLPPLEAGGHVPGLDGQGQLHLLGRLLERRAGQQLAGPDGAGEHAALRAGAGGEIGGGGLVEPDVDGHQVVGGQLGAGRQVGGRRPDRDGRVGRADDPRAEQDRAEDEEHAQHEPQVQPPGRADPAGRRTGEHLRRDRRGARGTDGGHGRCLLLRRADAGVRACSDARNAE